MNQYEEPSTPDLDDLQQNNEREAAIEVPVRVVDIGSVQTHAIPARHASMRSFVVTDTVQQLVGGNLRRQKVMVWATSETAGSYLYIGTDKNQVESSTSAMLPAPLNDFTVGMPFVLTMTHAEPIWAKAQTIGANPITVSVVTEDWAD